MVSFAFLHPGEGRIEIGDSLYTFQIIPDPVMFVWRVDSVAVQTKPHQNRLAIQFLFKK